MTEEEFVVQSALITEEMNIWISQILDPKKIPEKIIDIKLMLSNETTPESNYYYKR